MTHLVVLTSRDEEITEGQEYRVTAVPGSEMVEQLGQVSEHQEDRGGLRVQLEGDGEETEPEEEVPEEVQAEEQEAEVDEVDEGVEDVDEEEEAEDETTAEEMTDEVANDDNPPEEVILKF